ncbi:MAG: polyprenyl synthetase family protein [Clostridia bacterium]|nr:polyprenyl synthetase family protein [Clostridia bacterium]
MDFKNELINKATLINTELEKYVRKNECPEEILNQSMEYSLLAGGKRIRPVLIMATYELFKNDFDKTFPFAVAMEMIHTFSLIHDDLPGIDNDDYRRGKLTNHKKFNEATAILAGDSLLNYAYNLIINDIINSSEEKDKKLIALKELSYGIDRMIAGEYVDTEFEGKEISSQYLEYMHENKTGALIKASVRIGAILADADTESIAKLTTYAEKIGLAFQVKDDILSEIGDSKELGKPVGNDKERGKCTYTTKYGLEQAQKMLNDITNEAVEIISSFENGEFLKELALYIANRNK